MGVYNIDADFEGVNDYEGVFRHLISRFIVAGTGTASGTFNVNVNDITAGEVENITVTLEEDATGMVLLTLTDQNGNPYVVSFVFSEDDHGVISADYDLLRAGTYEVNAVYTGDGTYAPAEWNGGLTVSAGETDCSIEVAAENFKVTQDGTITVTLPEDATGKVYLYIEHSEGYTWNYDPVHITSEMNGKGELTVYDLFAGEYTVYAEYSGNGTYAPADGNASFTVTGGTDYCDINVDVNDIAVGEDEIISTDGSVMTVRTPYSEIVGIRDESNKIWIDTKKKMVIRLYKDKFVGGDFEKFRKFISVKYP